MKHEKFIEDRLNCNPKLIRVELIYEIKYKAEVAYRHSFLLRNSKEEEEVGEIYTKKEFMALASKLGAGEKDTLKEKARIIAKERKDLSAQKKRVLKAVYGVYEGTYKRKENV